MTNGLSVDVTRCPYSLHYEFTALDQRAVFVGFYVVDDNTFKSPCILVACDPSSGVSAIQFTTDFIDYSEIKTLPSFKDVQCEGTPDGMRFSFTYINDMSGKIVNSFRSVCMYKEPDEEQQLVFFDVVL